MVKSISFKSICRILILMLILILMIAQSCSKVRLPLFSRQFLIINLFFLLCQDMAVLGCHQ